MKNLTISEVKKSVTFQNDTISDLHSMYFPDYDGICQFNIILSKLQTLYKLELLCMENIKKLKIEVRSLLFINNDTFHNLKNLEEFYLEAPEIYNFPKDAFINSSKLEHIKLFLQNVCMENILPPINKLKTIRLLIDFSNYQLEFFKYMSKVKFIEITNSKGLNEHCLNFQYLPNLKGIKFYNIFCSLDKINSRIKKIVVNKGFIENFHKIGMLKKLKHLEINYCTTIIYDMPLKNVAKLKTLIMKNLIIRCKWLHYFNNVTYLDLSNCHIFEINDWLASKKSIANLKLNSNHMFTINFINFCNFSNLVTLDLSNSELINLIIGVFDGLYNLRLLFLNRNLISKLPKGIFHDLIALENLDLETNSIDYISSNWFNSNTVYNLKTLNLRNNCIQEIKDKTFQSLKNLKKLNLSENKLTEFNLNTFDELEKLTELDLSFNALLYLKADYFSKLNALECLMLQYNSIEAIEENAFHTVRKLKLLNLSYNSLTELHEKLLKYATSLQILNLANNSLTSISNNLLFYLSSLSVLYIGGNSNLKKLKTQLSKNDFLKNIFVDDY